MNVMSDVDLWARLTVTVQAVGAVAHAESVQHGGENLISSRTRNRTAAAAGMPRVQPVYFEDNATSGTRTTG